MRTALCEKPQLGFQTIRTAVTVYVTVSHDDWTKPFAASRIGPAMTGPQILDRLEGLDHKRVAASLSVTGTLAV